MKIVSTDLDPLDPYAMLVFEEQAKGNELAGRILNMLRLADQDVKRLKVSVQAYKRSFLFVHDSVDASLSDLVKRCKYHRQQRKLWQRRCKAVFRQAHGRAPTVEELDALVAKDWRRSHE